jgi:hypothetical protein
MAEILYADTLVEITRDSIVFRNYYFPFGSKKISLDHVKTVEILKPTLLNGKWRIHGTGDFRTWFPRDMKRPSRDSIFIMTLRNRWWRIGFTVENANAVKQIFEEKGLIRAENAA